MHFLSRLEQKVTITVDSDELTEEIVISALITTGGISP